MNLVVRPIQEFHRMTSHNCPQQRFIGGRAVLNPDWTSSIWRALTGLEAARLSVRE